MEPEPERQVEDDADDRSRDGGERRGEQAVAAKSLAERRADEDEEETGKESDPGGEQTPQGAGEEGIDALGLAGRTEEADELILEAGIAGDPELKELFPVFRARCRRRSPSFVSPVSLPPTSCRSNKPAPTSRTC